jgi:GH25 family lysozyme M1 (1,4-beta-N-acetylmuramidase)
VPIPREAALAGKVTITYADVATPPTFEEMVAVLGARWERFRDGFRMPVVKTVPRRAIFGIVQYVAWKRSGQRTPEQIDAAFAAADPVSTASTALDSAKR